MFLLAQSALVRKVLLLSLVLLGTVSKPAWSLPLETFTAPLSLTCGERDRECGGVLRVHDALGRHTGISILKGVGGEVTVRSGRRPGIFYVEADDVADVSITFSWDGDSNPEVLSGSGLNCFDLTRQGAYAFVVSKMNVESSCTERPIPGECPQFTVHSRVYDSQDPTGQRFSESTILRREVEESDVVIPFSNFVRFGPRGKGSFTCTGAVTIAFKFTGLEDLDLQLGPIYTNGDEMLTPLATAPPSSATPETSATPLSEGTAPVATLAPQQSTVSSAPSGFSPTSEDVAASAALPDAKLTAEGEVITPAPATVTKTPKRSNSEDEPAEAVYGSVVVGQ
jgi:hypothetical protein